METLALPKLLLDLKLGLTEKDAIVIIDDSPPKIFEEIKQRCLESSGDLMNLFMCNDFGGKSGRGAAVRRGMELVLSKFPLVETILECDGDGSHRPADILKIKNSTSEADLLVGSRYLANSKIVGWSVSRRTLSWFLNQSIPRLVKVNLTDITNGLRRYSKKAVIEILSTKQKNTGFIYLSEQAILISRANMVLSEEPIIFVDRKMGESTVTWRELFNSLRGVLKLILTNR